MAPKRQNPMEVPPTVSSSEEEEEEVSSEEEESDDEPSKISSPPSSPKNPENSVHGTTTTTATQQPASSSSGSSSESEAEADDAEGESESESEPETPTGSPIRNVKPIATKPMESVTKSTGKRPSEQSPKPSKDSKIRKKDAAVENSAEDSKKLSFQRLWSENDEIVLLKGMLDYASVKEENPFSDFDGFFNFIKNSVHFEASRSQFQDKMRRLKKRYETALGRVRKGEEPNLPKAHDQKCYDLSKKLWGNGEVTGVLHTPNGKSRVSAKKSQPQKSNKKTVDPITPEVVQDPVPSPVVQDDQKADIQNYMDLSMNNVEHFVVNEGRRLVKGQAKAVMEEKWKKHRSSQVELFLEKLELMRESAQLVLQSYKSDI